jgi:hypothetical protein
MLKSCLTLLAAALLASCASVPTADQDDSDERAWPIHARFKSRADHIAQNRDDLLGKLDSYCQRLRVQIVDSPYRTPARRVDLLESLRSIRKSCMTGTASQGCWDRYNAEYSKLLGSRYSHADFGKVLEAHRAGGSRSDLELALAESHNAALGDFCGKNRDKIQDFARNAHQQAVKARDQELEFLQQQRESEKEAERRRSMRRMGTMFRSHQDGTGRASRRHGDSPLYPPRRQYDSRYISSGCTSDLDCGVGQKCWKDRLEHTGHCVSQADTPTGCTGDSDCEAGLKCVRESQDTSGYCSKPSSEYVLQTLELPGPETTLPELPLVTRCESDLDCPVGFSCRSADGACVTGSP